MSLLQEAGENIRKGRADRIERIKEQEEYTRKLPQIEEQQRRDEEERKKLSSELVLRTEELLENYAVIPNADRYKGLRGRAVTVWAPPKRVLLTTLTDDKEEPINVIIRSNRIDPKKSNIIVEVQGINTYLEIPKDRSKPFLLRQFSFVSGSSVTLEDLRKYSEVVNKVREKLVPPGL